ncbi:hypothetical protein Droror1_Dr00017784 [Drosera rotundifolia]
MANMEPKNEISFHYSKTYRAYQTYTIPATGPKKKKKEDLHCVQLPVDLHCVQLHKTNNIGFIHSFDVPTNGYATPTRIQFIRNCTLVQVNISLKTTDEHKT